MESKSAFGTTWYVFSVTSPAVERRYARKFPLLLERGEGVGDESNIAMRWFWFSEQAKNNPSP